MPMMSLLLSILLCIQLLQPGASKDLSMNIIQRNMTLRVAITGRPPLMFDTKEAKDRNGPASDRLGTNLSGFQIDLLASIRGLAAREDGIDLAVEIEDFSKRYNPPTGLNLVKSDCLTNPRNDTYDTGLCGKFDLYASPLFANSREFTRVDYGPTILQDYVGATRYDPSLDLTQTANTTATANTANNGDVSQRAVHSTFESLDRVNGTICTYFGFNKMIPFFFRRYPNIKTILCKGEHESYPLLKQGNCSLIVFRAFFLKYEALADPSLVVTQEAFGKQYVSWAMNPASDPELRSLVKKWTYISIQEGLVDQTYDRYLTPELCPLGWAGETCQNHCDPTHGRSDQFGQCICSSTRYVGDDCATEVLHNTGMIPHYQIVAGYILFGINVAVVLGCLLWLLENWKRSHVVMAQPPLLLLILLGCLISTSTIPALMQEAEPEDTVDHCMLIPWLYSVGFSVTFGSLFARIWRVQKIIHEASRMRRVKVPLLSALQWIAIVLCGDMAILSAWQATDPMTWKRRTTSQDQFGAVLASSGTCTSDHWAWFAGAIGVFHFTLLGVASFMVYHARNVPNQLSGAKGVSIAMVCNFQTFLIGVPLLVLVGSDPNSSFFLRSAIVWLNDLAVVLAVFGELMFRKSTAGTAAQIISQTTREVMNTNVDSMQDSFPSGVNLTSHSFHRYTRPIQSSVDDLTKRSNNEAGVRSEIEEISRALSEQSKARLNGDAEATSKAE